MRRGVAARRFFSTCPRLSAVLSERQKDLLKLNLTEVVEWIKTDKTNATEVAEATSTQIERVNEEFKLNAFCVHENDQIAEEKKKGPGNWKEDLILKASSLSHNSSDSSHPSERLYGVPVGVKDNFCQKGARTSCASKMLHSFSAPYTSTVVDQLEKNGALVPSIHCNMDEFAMGSGSVRSVYGPVHNPWIGNEDNGEFSRSAGGSSGGSTASVASFALYASMGSDTGGSIRLPASWCGVVGLKPSYGRVSRHGLVAFGSSFDCPSFATRSVRDSALLLDCISGSDPLDVNTIPEGPTNFAKDPSIWNITDLSSSSSSSPGRPLRIGIPKEYNVQELSKEYLSLWESVAESYRASGAEIVEVSMPHTSYALGCYYIISGAEASSNLSRFDGIRYGHRDERPLPIEELVEVSRSTGFGPEVKRRILTGAFVLSQGSYNEYFRRAQQVRRLIYNDFTNVFQNVDVMLTPVAASYAPTISSLQNNKNPVDEYVCDIMTIPSSLAGVPAISVPVALSSTGLPLGMQLIAPYGGEKSLLTAAHALEEMSRFSPFPKPLHVL
eukprot:TRINITY_DN2123_c0_g1_i1.p1 TRINITY_DN2123_c0_g1~~TRINITY_DN2123_c0_g1_i1.p1  ORF type:complete len:556 (+),score=200.20 TRINITY_DN2123_c0_g1_i1:3-1670(+)